jgi:hypothetical protein
MKFQPRMGLSTGRGILVLIAAPALAGLVTVQPAHALAPPLLPHLAPASLDPAGTKMVVTDPLSNFQKSCAWDLNCSDGATPYTHSTDEDALGRLGGWMVVAQWNGRHGRQMTFILFGSAYDTAAHGQAAAADYQAQLTSPRFQMKHFPCPVSVTAVDSHTFCARYHDRSLLGGHYFSLSASEGSIEIELLSFANTRFNDFRRDTFAQAQAALGGITD